MATVKSSASSTIIALLSTINSGATSIAKIIDSGSSSVDMLDRYVQRAKTRQTESHLVEDRHWRTNLILDAAKAQAKREEALERELQGNARLQQLFVQNEAELKSLFTETQP